MKIAIISDTHFGFKENNPELWQDCYINADNAFETAIKNGVELIIMPGDIFDLEIPTQETFDRTFKVFSCLIGTQKLTPLDKMKTVTKVPIVVIPGTHEFRGKNYKGPIDILESAGYIYKIEKENIMFEHNTEKVAVSGMKGVPEKVAKDLLLSLNFKPIENAVNILVLHQSFKEFLPFDDEMVATLTLEDLPNGFDLYVNGHIHLSNTIQTEKGTFILPGSTIFTQLKKAELEKKKGFYLYDTITRELKFIEIADQREYYLREIKTDNESKEEIIAKIKNIIAEIENNAKEYTHKLFETEFILKPVLKIKLKGRLLSGYKTSDISEKEFKTDKMILILEKDLEIKELEEKIKNIDIEKEKDAALSKSSNIFITNLENSGFKKSFNPEEIIELLKKDDIDKAVEIIMKNDLK